MQDLRAIGARARVIGTAMVAVESDSPSARRRAAVMLRDEISALPRDLVSSVTFDRRPERAYGWANRWLFVDLADLEQAKAALADEIAHKKQPLLVELDPGSGASASLRDRLAKAEHDKDDPGEYVSPDQRLQMMIVHTGFSSGDVDKDKILLDALLPIVAKVKAAVPGVEAGIAGDVVVSPAEHDSILNGMLLATVLTVLLVLFSLWWFFRSPLAIGALSWSLMVGTLSTFAFTFVAIGHLNLATAFLSSIVIGNGINVGILVTARYLEELRGGNPDALGDALAGTLAGTLAAALTAAAAYGSLVLTVFRGFRHFGIIGGAGILLCWISAYTVLPACLAIARRAGMKPRSEPAIGRWLARLLPKNLTAVAVAAVGVTVIAGAITARYITDDPFESNFKNLRSHSAGITEERRWMHAIDAAFGEGIDAGFVIALSNRAEVMPLKRKLRAADVGKADRDVLFDKLASLDDLLPSEQPAKLAVLAEIRALLSGKDMDLLDDDERAEAEKLRPPEGLRVLGDADVPDALAWPFIEADGSRGKVILATPGTGYEVWDAHDTVRFADKVRALQLPSDVHLGGASFVFADVIDAVLTDGPRATLAAIAGAVLVVLLVVGRNRHALVSIACGISGTIVMLAVGSLLGLRVNFLDFVALPITIGIGIEYSVNIATRERQEGPGHGRAALATTGGAVFLCSYTTIVGYGSLLLSKNLGIHSFGLAAMLGELSCLAMAIVLAPSLLWITAPAYARDQALRPSSAAGTRRP